MNITEVKVRIKDPESNGSSKVLAYADFVIDGVFKVSGLAIINAVKGIVIGMPFREYDNANKKNGKERKEICYPITNQCREMIESAVLDKYEEELNG